MPHVPQFITTFSPDTELNYFWNLWFFSNMIDCKLTDSASCVRTITAEAPWQHEPSLCVIVLKMLVFLLTCNKKKVKRNIFMVNLTYCDVAIAQY